MPIFAFSPKTVPVHAHRHYINISLFHMPSTLVFRLLEFLSIWDVCNPSFKVFAYNVTGGAITCSNQNSGVGRIDSFQFFYFILEAVVVQLLPRDKFQEWKCWTKCSTHWNFWSILPTCHLERFYDFTFLSAVFAYLLLPNAFQNQL